MAQWLPRGAADAEKLARQKVQALKNYRQRRQQVAALTPRKSRLLWLLPLPLVPAMLIALAGGQFAAFVGNACAYGLFLAGAILTRHGFRQAVMHRQLRFQKGIRWPFKTMGGLTIALATAVTAGVGAGHDLPIAVGFGIGALAAYVMLYGIDGHQIPRLVKGDAASLQPVIREALQQAERQIFSIEQAGNRINQHELNERLTRIIALARDILFEIARDPRDFRRARKFLTTYLDGAERVVKGYAETHTQLRTPILEDNFRRVLVTIEEVFGQQYQRLLDNDVRDLDVDMEVLENQLKSEGL
ncbi:MAG: 5-bromo-4-chloroindolyl phosphate hydrolysis family protein [Desulfofustis sp.]|nr:5-bromo-4-chloroindolyl phosphate hydrolysis family protein [Desulfofustis sp.]